MRQWAGNGCCLLCCCRDRVAQSCAWPALPVWQHSSSCLWTVDLSCALTQSFITVVSHDTCVDLISSHVTSFSSRIWIKALEMFGHHRRKSFIFCLSIFKVFLLIQIHFLSFVPNLPSFLFMDNNNNKRAPLFLFDRPPSPPSWGWYSDHTRICGPSRTPGLPDCPALCCTGVQPCTTGADLCNSARSYLWVLWLPSSPPPPSWSPSSWLQMVVWPHATRGKSPAVQQKQQSKGTQTWLCCSLTIVFSVDCPCFYIYSWGCFCPWRWLSINKSTEKCSYGWRTSMNFSCVPQF